MKKLILMLKRPYVIVIFVIFIIVLIFILMQISIKPVMEQVKNAFLSKDYYVSYDRYSNYPQRYSNPNVNYVIYDDESTRFDVNRWFNRMRCYSGEEPESIKIDLELGPVFTLNNFTNGYIWFWYYVECIDKNGNSSAGAGTSLHLPVKMKIHRENGVWRVVEIDEHV